MTRNSGKPGHSASGRLQTTPGRRFHRGNGVRQRCCFWPWLSPMARILALAACGVNYVIGIIILAAPAGRVRHPALGRPGAPPGGYYGPPAESRLIRLAHAVLESAAR